MKDDCSIYSEKLSAYIDGQLPPDEMARVAAHLETCESCPLLLEKMRRVDDMAERIMPEFDEALMARLEERIAAGIDEPGRAAADADMARPKVIPIWYRYVAVAASVVIVFLAGRMALKESGGDLRRPSVSFDAPKPVLVPTLVDTVVPYQKEERESAHADEALTDGVRDRAEREPAKRAEKKGTPGGKGGEVPPEEPVTLEEQAAADVPAAETAPLAEEIAEKPRLTADDSERKQIATEADQSEAGPSGNIKGRIIDAATGKPLPGVSVQVQGTNIGAMSDNDGEFDIQGVPPDTYSLVSSSPGYRVMYSQVMADTGRMSAETIPMEPVLVDAGTVIDVSAEDVDELETAIILPGVDSLNAIYASMTLAIREDEEAKDTRMKAAFSADAGTDRRRERAQRIVDSLESVEAPPDPAEYLTLRYLQAVAAADLANIVGGQDEINKAAENRRKLEEALNDLSGRGFDSDRLDSYRRAIDRRMRER